MNLDALLDDVDINTLPAKKNNLDDILDEAAASAGLSSSKKLRLVSVSYLYATINY